MQGCLQTRYLFVSAILESSNVPTEPHRTEPIVGSDDALLTARTFHYLTYAFAISSPEAGWDKTTGQNKTTGILAAILPELRAYGEGNRPDTLTIIAAECDSPSALDQPVQVMAATPEWSPQSKIDRLAVWFDQMWATFHPNAFTAPALSVDLLRELFVHDYTSPLGTLAQLREHYAVWGPLKRAPGVPGGFADRFASLLARLPPGAIVHWSDLFFADLIIRIGPSLRARGVFQTFHHHLALPPSLFDFPYGERVLRAMSIVDRVYLHTDAFVELLKSYFGCLQFRVPEVKRFDLGPDFDLLRDAVKPGALARPARPSAAGRLTRRQQELLRDAEDSRWRVSHRFICMDRLDPIKGSHVVLEATEQFLGSRGWSVAELQRSYRFYFLMDDFEAPVVFDPRDVRHRYARYVRSVVAPRLESKFPGVVFMSGHISDKAVVARLLLDANVLVGGVQEGLNLVVQEGLYVNYLAQTGRTAVVGDGAGFAIQAAASGFSSCAEYPKAGSASAFASSIERVAATRPGEHRGRTSRLVEGFIVKRRSLMCPSRDE